MLALLANAAIITTLILLLGYALRAIAARSMPEGYLKFWIFPGVIVHEVSHALACIPAMAKLHRVSFMTSEASGEVEHEKPRLKIIGPLLISLAPLAGGLCALIGLNILLGNPLHTSGVITGNAAMEYTFPLLLFERAGTDIQAAWNGAVWLDWRTYLMAWLVFSISLGMIPSGQDLRNSAISMLCLLVVLVAAWFALEKVLRLEAGKALASGVTWVLGFAHIILLYFAIDVVLLLVVSLLARLLVKQEAAAGANTASGAQA